MIWALSAYAALCSLALAYVAVICRKHIISALKFWLGAYEIDQTQLEGDLREGLRDINFRRAAE